MTNLFGKTELEKLRDLDYKTESHTFSKGVIAAYYNGLEYPMEVTNDYILVKRRKGNVFFKLGNEHLLIDEEKDIIYTPIKTEFTKVKTKEVIYDLNQIFIHPTGQVQRGVGVTKRPEVIVTRGVKGNEIKKLYEEWSEHKMNDPKVFRIAFTPKRYLRSFDLYDKGFNVAEFGYYVKGELYAILCYEVQGDIAFELAYISRFWDKKQKIVNDLNELLLINSFWQLYEKGVKRINVGTSASIKGLKMFKNKLPHTYVEIFSN